MVKIIIRHLNRDQIKFGSDNFIIHKLYSFLKYFLVSSQPALFQKPVCLNNLVLKEKHKSNNCLKHRHLNVNISHICKLFTNFLICLKK